MYIYGGKSMLTKFSVENYKSFNKKITMDLTKAHDYDFNREAIKNGVIKNAVIFGQNGSGKSNFSLALFDIVVTLTDKNCDGLQLDPNSFLNFNSSKKSATFSYEFMFKDKIVQYEYKKSSPQALTFEKLKINGDVVFSCDFIQKKFSSFELSQIGLESFTYDSYAFDLPFLRYLRGNTSHKDDSVVKFIFDFANKMLWFRSLQTTSYVGVKNGAEYIIPWIIDHGFVNDFKKFLSDVGGINLSLDVATTNNPLPQKTLIIVNDNKTKALSFELVKSSGTNALLILFYWYKQLNDVSFIFIDEFDAFYHFELSKKVIEIFKQMPDVQAIFTSHNTYIASNDILRPDCYFTLSDGTIKSFCERTDRELREGHNLEKLLRGGEFDE